MLLIRAIMSKQIFMSLYHTYNMQAECLTYTIFPGSWINNIYIYVLSIWIYVYNYTNTLLTTQLHGTNASQHTDL